jgi:hypothetical protein
MKIRQKGAELLHADGQTDRQTDMTKLTVAFLNFANAPKNPQPISFSYLIFIHDQLSI